MARAMGVYTIYIGVSVVTGAGVLWAYYGCAVGILLACSHPLVNTTVITKGKSDD